MRKVTDFIVKFRYFFLCFFVVLALFCLYLSTKVTINEDIMKYLPKTSETKIGKDIMDKEFISQDSSTLNVMFKDLSKKEKQKTLEKLEKIKGVNSVLYDDTKEYNKGKYTLYVLNVSDYADSKVATSVYNYVNDNFKISAMSGDIYEENKPILQISIVIFAIVCAMIILVILSDSYIEPFLYLISIGIAVFINKGTNLMFDSVSSITNSIVAILQLALSMDYSIMLSNRYKQEKEKHSNKLDAMKEALYHSFKSISSSSVTTIVGLLALVFMSFTIGRDLGFVLAKGVLLSLVSIFFCLPALLLIFDNLILKTKKKSPKFNLTKLGEFSYKTRYVQGIIIIILFIVSYFLKGNVGILYTGSEQDKVGKVFPSVNQMAVVYENKYEDLIASYCKELGNDKKIDSVLCYSNTINEKLAYDKLNDKFSELGQDSDIDNELIKIIYYNYYNKDKNNKMTLSEFVSFIKTDILTNDRFSNSVSSSVTSNIDTLYNFTNKELINKNRSVEEIANILGISVDDAKNILIYYNSKNLDTKMSINEFVNFILNDVANDPLYSSQFDSNTLQKLKMLQPFTDNNVITRKMNSNELSNVFGIDQNLIEQLMLFYRVSNESNTKLTLTEFADISLMLSQDDNYKAYFDNNTISQLQTIKSLSSVYNTTLSNDMLYNMFGISSDIGSNLNYLITGDLSGGYSMTPIEFVNMLLTNPNIVTNLSQDQVTNLQLSLFIMSNVNTEYSSSDLANVLGKDKSLINTIYGVYDYKTGSTTLTPLQFANLIISNKDNKMLSGKVSASSLQQLYLVREVMNSSIKNYKYSYSDIGNLLGVNSDKLSLLFSLYNSKYIKENEEISLYNFVNFIISDVITNQEYSDKFDEKSREKLSTINRVMNDSIGDKLYTSDDTYKTLKVLSNSLDKNLIDLVYIYYGSVYNYDDSYSMTVEEFINYLNDDILTDSRFTNFIDSSKRKVIISAKKKIDKSKKLIVSDKYSRMVLNTKYTPEGKDVYKFVNNMEKKIGNNEGIYIVGDSPMAVEISKTFNDELNKITLLTMLFIFVVVALTFKDLIIPFVLVLIIQSAVYITMSAISVTGGSVYFISLLIVQAILMGATIDYAIVYTAYYRESRLTMGIKDAVVNAYNKSIHTILSSSSILIIVTLVVANFASAIAAKICETISQGTFASVILILFMLPGVLAACDKFICRKGYYKSR